MSDTIDLDAVTASPIATKAAAWWANQWNRPSSTAGDANVDLALLAAASGMPQADDTTREQYSQTLAKIVQLYLDDTNSCTISVDYHADAKLMWAAQQFDVYTTSMSSFPVKTTMHVYPDRIELWHGYGAAKAVLTV